MTTAAEYQKQYEALHAAMEAISKSWTDTTTHRNEALDRLEQGHVEAQKSLEAVKAQWALEDEDRRLERWRVMERHAQGARDRDRLRIELGGESKYTADPDPAPEAARQYQDDPAAN